MLCDCEHFPLLPAPVVSSVTSCLVREKVGADLMARSSAAKSVPLPLVVWRSGDLLTLENPQGVIPLTAKWAVFYALLALRQGQPLTLDELCDHHVWSKQAAASAGREVWRFVREHETRVFGGRISTSPARQATKVFSLLPELSSQVQFDPSPEIVADYLNNLRSHRSSQAVRLSELTLLMQSGHVEAALEQLRLLKKQPLALNDLAHTEVMITTALDRLYGSYGTAKQVETLIDLKMRE